ncbi:hypothetical protein G9A89_015811, partial [Geosiphon pyriformis]
LKTVSGGDMSKKKVPKGAFYGPAGGFFAQKKRVVLGNVKHSGNKKDISLSKSGSGDSVYSNVDSLSGDDEDVGMTDVHGGSLLGLAVTTPKAKCVNTGTIVLPLRMSIPLDKKWIDPKIGKTQVEMSVKKSFALDINLLAVEGKSAMAKTQTTSLVRANNIIVNSDLKRQRVCSDRAIVIKKIPMDIPKEMIVTAVSEFGEIKSIKIQLIEMWQKAAVKDRETWAFRDQFRVLLFTLLMGMTAHDLGTLLEGAGKKTCVINHSLETGNRTRCAMICFESDKAMESAFRMEPIFGSVKLLWARLDLIRCNWCGKFGYSVLECNAKVVSASQSPKSFKKPANLDTHLQLAKLYAKKKILISCPVAFGGKSWAQVVSVASVSHGSCDGSGSGSLPFGVSSSSGTPPLSMVNSPLGTCLARLECSVELLSDRILNILHHLDNLSLVSLAPPSSVILSVGTPFLSVSNFLLVANFDLGSNMVLDVLLIQPISLSSGIDNSQLGLSIRADVCWLGFFGPLLVLMTSYIWKIAMCNVREMNNPAKQKDIIRWHKEINNMILIVTKTKLKDEIRSWIMNKFVGIRVFTSGLNSGYMGSEVAIIMNNFLAWHMCKVSNIPGWFLSIKLLFRNKLSVLVLELYARSSLAVRFFQADDINSLIARAVNESSFIILGGDFNEDGSRKSASFRKCFDLGLVNSLSGNLFGKEATWANSRGVAKIINYVFVSLSLVNTILDHNVSGVEEYFDTDHKAVFVSVGLGGLLDVQLNSLCRQANKNCWKYNFVDASFHFDAIRSALAKIRKSYHSSKLLESNHAKKSQIKSVIDKRMESFELNKSHTVHSVLERPFRKVVLDHLVVGDELVLDPAPVKSKIDEIMKVVLDVNDEWSCQYCLLGYVFNEAFSGVMGLIDFDKLFGVVSNLPDGKAAGLSGISNELWKHCDILVLNMLLVLLNSCLSEKSSVLTNTRLIALIEMACKILSKILSDRISSACSTHNVLHGDNFSVLKGMTTQSPIFAVELWLVLQDMRKVYNSVGWEHLEKCLVRIKMCNRFIRFFGSIHKDRTNQVMTNFGLTDGYRIHDSLDQGERQESMYEYRLISHFISKSGRVELQAGLSSYFAAGVFVDDTIWVGSRQSATQHILDVASKFFQINDISINNDKTVAIPINCRVRDPAFFISGLPISVAKKGEFHQYLDIFLLTESLFKPSLAKVHSNIHFFTNLVLKKAISDKQFLYLVSVVLQLIISYRTQFSFDAMICKGLKLKSGLPLNFPSNSIHHSFFYDLKFFLQIQSEDKVASLINFANSGGIVGHLFSHRSYDLQVLCWHSIHSLSSPVRIRVSASNNFLMSVVHMLYNCKLSLSGFFANSFRVNGEMLMSTVLDESVFSGCLSLLQWYDVVFVDQLHDHHGTKKLDPCGPIPEWFRLSTVFLAGENSSPAHIPVLANISLLDILGFSGFMFICDRLSQINTRVLSVYTDGLLRNLGTIGCKTGAAAFFKDIGMSLGVGVSGLMSSTMAKLQAIALAFECVPVFSNVHLFSDSQSALDACKSELDMVAPDFQNRCWIERRHIVNVISSKILNVTWHKVKGHSGVLENEHADVIASADSVSDWFLSPHLDEHFLMANGNIVSGNSRHFVHNTFHAMCHAHWEVGSGSKFLPDNLWADIDWYCSSLLWHPDLHMATSFTSRISANARSYFIKALHHQLFVAVQKWLYNRLYFSILCLYCGDIEVLYHVFSCKVNGSVRHWLLDSHMNTWKTLSGFFVSFSCLLQLLLSCVLGSSVSMALLKGFVFDNWFCEAVSVFHNPKVACLKFVNFTHSLGLTFRDEI